MLLVAGDRQTPRSGVPVVLRDDTGREVARAVTDFDGFVLFDALPFGNFRAEAHGQVSAPLALSREAPDGVTRLLLPPARGA